MRKLSLTAWILIGMVGGHRCSGIAAPGAAQGSWLRCSNIFLRLIKSIIAPLLFGTLVAGIAGRGSDLKTMGRIGGKAILYFEVVTTLALLLGLAAVNLVQPGAGLHAAAGAAARASGAADADQTLRAVLEHTFPDQHYRCDGARGRAADRGVLVSVRGGVRGDRGEGGAGGGVLRIAFGSDVPVHELRDVARAVGRVRRDGG